MTMVRSASRALSGSMMRGVQEGLDFQVMGFRKCVAGFHRQPWLDKSLQCLQRDRYIDRKREREVDKLCCLLYG